MSYRCFSRAAVVAACLLIWPLGASAQGDGDGGEESSSGKLTKAPSLVSQPEIVYPESALDALVEGTVVLKITIGVDGAVTAAEAIDGPELLREAAVTAARALTFDPAQIDGAPAAVTLKFNIDFELPPSRVQGVAIATSDRSALAGARVVLSPMEGDGESFDALTGEDGRFELQDIPHGRYRIEAAVAGFEPTVGEVVIRPGAIIETELAMRATEPSAGEVSDDAAEDGEVTDGGVVTTRAREIPPGVTQRTLSREEIRRVPGTRGDIVRVVQNLPGVARPRFLGGQLVVRGAAPQDTRILFEGDLVPGVFHFLAGPAVVQSDMLAGLDFFPGNFGVQYGRATAAVLNLRTRAPRDDKFHGVVNIDLLDSSLLLEGPIMEDLVFAVGVRRSYIDVLLRPFSKQLFGSTTFVAPRYYDYQGWLRYTGLDDHTFELLLYGSRDTFAVINPESEDDEDSFGFSNLFYRGQLRWLWEPSSQIKNKLSASFGTGGTRLEAGDFLYDNLLTLSIVREELTLEINEAATLRMGANFELGRANVEIVEPPQEDDIAPAPGSPAVPEESAYPGEQLFLSAIDDQSQLNPAFFVDAIIRPWRGAEIIPGFRVDHFGTIKAETYSPRLAVRQSFGPKLTLRGGAGLFTQPPQSLYTNEVFGTRKLLPERAIHYALGVGWRPWEHILLDVEGFYRDSDQLVVQELDITINDDGSVDYSLFNNKGEGRAYGMEVLLRHDPKDGFFGWIAYTLSRSERKNINTGEWDIYESDQTHILALIGGYELPRGFNVSARYRLVSGFPYTPVDAAVYDSDSNNYEPVYGKPNSAREVPFSQLDVRGEKTWVYDYWKLTAYLDILNVTNRRNVEFSSFTYDYSERREISGLPIIPTLGVRGEW